MRSIQVAVALSLLTSPATALASPTPPLPPASDPAATRIFEAIDRYLTDESSTSAELERETAACPDINATDHRANGRFTPFNYVQAVCASIGLKDWAKEKCPRAIEAVSGTRGFDIRSSDATGWVYKSPESYLSPLERQKGTLLAISGTWEYVPYSSRNSTTEFAVNGRVGFLIPALRKAPGMKELATWMLSSHLSKGEWKFEQAAEAYLALGADIELPQGDRQETAAMVVAAECRPDELRFLAEKNANLSARDRRFEGVEDRIRKSHRRPMRIDPYSGRVIGRNWSEDCAATMRVYEHFTDGEGSRPRRSSPASSASTTVTGPDCATTHQPDGSTVTVCNSSSISISVDRR